MEYEMCSVNGVIFHNKEEMQVLLNKFTYVSKEEEKTGNSLHNLFKHMTVCHSVNIEYDDNDNI